MWRVGSLASAFIGATSMALPYAKCSTMPCCKASLRILEVTEIKSVPYVPRSHPFIERVIGSIRREYLDRAPFWNSLDLERKLSEFKDYYNNHRTHASLSGHSPAKFGQQANEAFANINDYGWQQHCRGLFHSPIPA